MDILDFTSSKPRSNRDKIFEYIKSRRSLIHRQEPQFSNSILGLPDSDWNYIVSLIQGDRKLAIEVASLLAKYTHDVPLKFNPPEEEKMHRDFKSLEMNRLQKIPNEQCQLRGEPYSYPVNGTFVYNWNLTGLVVANAFMLPAMCNVESDLLKENLYSQWEKESFRCTVFRNMLNLNMGSGVGNVFSAIKTGTYFPSNFRPTVAKEIYNVYGINKPTVLDFSSGFGGRFTGFWSSNARHYIGVDPNSALLEPYKQLQDWLQTGYPKPFKSYEFIQAAAEDIDYGGLKGEVGLVFTSPPYFDIERYSQEETQSFKRYNTPDLWLDGFLFKVLGKMSQILEEGDYCIINICDSPSREYKLCDAMCQFMRDELGFEVLPALKMKLASRPGKSMIKGSMGEPMWVFRRR